MAKDIETRHEETAMEQQGASKAQETLEDVRARANEIVGELPESVTGFVDRYPIASCCGAMAVGFLLAGNPLVPRGLIRAALATFGGKFLGDYAAREVLARMKPHGVHA